METKQTVAVLVIIIVAAIAVGSISMFYKPSTKNVAGEAYFYYNTSAAENFTYVEGNFSLVGVDGRSYEVIGVVDNVTSCSDSDGGIDSTIPGYVSFTHPTITYSSQTHLADSCWGFGLSEVACGKDVDLSNPVNRKTMQDLGYDNYTFQSVGLWLNIKHGATIFDTGIALSSEQQVKANAKKVALYQGDCVASNSTVSLFSYYYNSSAKVFWKDAPQCTKPGVTWCVGDAAYTCSVNRNLENISGCSGCVETAYPYSGACVPAPVTCVDNDKDGYNQSAAGCGVADCNDSVSLINPENSPNCDCNGTIYSQCYGAPECTKDSDCGFTGDLTVCQTQGVGKYVLNITKYNSTCSAPSSSVWNCTRKAYTAVFLPCVYGCNGSSTCYSAPDWNIAKKVFVTQTKTNGDIKGNVSAKLNRTFSTGIEAANALCQKEANDAGLSGTYKAWLSDSSTSPSLSFTKSNGPYAVIVNLATVNYTGIIIAKNWVDLTDGTLLNPIYFTAKGTQSLSSVGTWTNTRTSGQVYNAGINYTCNNWAASRGIDNAFLTSMIQGNFDIYSNSSVWTQGAAICLGCTCSRYLYCFEQ